MRSISARQFKEFIEKDPSWASKLKERVEVRTYANMDNTNITHLSPFLLFSGRNAEGNVASFKGCAKLKVAEGNFDGFVDFGASYNEMEVNLEAEGGNDDNLSILEKEAKVEKEQDKTEDIIDLPFADPVGIEKIGDIKILRPNNKGYAVDYTGCIHLNKYRGTYPGHINIGHNDLLRWQREMTGGTEREEIEIEDLSIEGESNKGICCTINNTIINKLRGNFGSTIRLVGTEVKSFGDPREDLNIQPNATGTKIELKNNCFTSKVEVNSFAQDFPFEAHELELPRASTKKEADPLAELRDVLKIKKALLTNEDPKKTIGSWGKTIKRKVIRTIAECLQADDILKKEGHKAKSRTRLSKILNSSALLATVILYFGGNTLLEVGNKVRENTIIEPTAAKIQEFTSDRFNKSTLDMFTPEKIEEKRQELNKEKEKEMGEKKETTTNKESTEGVDVLKAIVNDLEWQKSISSLSEKQCESPSHCCHKKGTKTSLSENITLASL